MAAFARALRLVGTERAHLFTLADLAAPASPVATELVHTALGDLVAALNPNVRLYGFWLTRMRARPVCSGCCPSPSLIATTEPRCG